MLRRPKLPAYVSRSETTVFLTELARVVELVPIGERVELCRDPRDDKFLELALAGRAHFVLTGDADLLALHPFRGTEIVTPTVFSATPSAGRDVISKGEGRSAKRAVHAGGRPYRQATAPWNGIGRGTILDLGVVAAITEDAAQRWYPHTISDGGRIGLA